MFYTISRESAFSNQPINLYKKSGLCMCAAVNQRSEDRYSCLVPVEGKEGSEFDRAKTWDISRHGIGLISSHSIGINQKIALEIVLKPNTEPVVVIGVVKWIRKLGASGQYRAGMVFQKLISDSGNRLDKYLTSKRW